MHNYNNKHFVLKDITIFPYYLNYILGFCVTVPAFYFFGEKGLLQFGIWGMIFVFFMIGIVILFIYKFFLTTTVIISFDEDALIITEKNMKMHRYLKEDILGFFTYDYEKVEKSFVSIQFRLKNGKNLNFSDTSVSQKIDLERANMLKRFLFTTKLELNMVYIKKNKARSLQKLGACWYGPKIPQKRDIYNQKF